MIKFLSAALVAQAAVGLWVPPEGLPTPWMQPRTVQQKVLAHVSTDKPAYKAMDVIFIEVYLADAQTKRPYLTETSTPVKLKVSHLY